MPDRKSERQVYKANGPKKVFQASELLREDFARKSVRSFLWIGLWEGYKFPVWDGWRVCHLLTLHLEREVQGNYTRSLKCVPCNWKTLRTVSQAYLRKLKWLQTKISERLIWVYDFKYMCTHSWTDIEINLDVWVYTHTHVI